MLSQTNTVGGVVTREGGRRFRRMAAVLRRYPWMARLGQRFLHLIQPRFTVGVIGLLLDETGQRVLLVEHVFHAQCPWGMPGGWIDRGETPEQAVVREFHEETGLRVRVVRPLVVDMRHEIRNHIDLIFLCRLDGESGPIRLSYELLGYQWAAVDDLPLLMAVQREAIEGVRGG